MPAITPLSLWQRLWRRLRPAPPQTITLSFAAMILAGALLLNLPAASQSGQSVGFLNALFTATSANCVTGLVVVNTLAHWTLFGKIVILALIQLGGLGLIAILAVSMVLLRRRISLRSRLTIQASFNQEDVGGMVRLVRTVVLITLAAEGAGMVLLTAGFYCSSALPFGQALWLGFFQSISSFCNAGFDIVGEASLMPYQANVYINFVVMALIVIGGLGFPVLGELLHGPSQGPKRSMHRRMAHLSLHAKLALAVTAWLLVGGTVLILLCEWSNPETLGPMSVPQKLLAALFQSVTLRTCGYNTISQAGLTEASKFISCVLMAIGGSPAGTAGGMKTVAFGIILMSMISMVRGRPKVEAYGRSLALDLLQKALTVGCALLIVITAGTLLLSFTERGMPYPHGFLDLLFETASAAGTVGVTTGITPHLSAAGRIIIIFCMFLGRLGPITVVVALNMRQHKSTSSATFPEERVLIG